MKNEHKHFLARLLVGAFLVLGMGFRMTNFVVKAESWTIGSITRNNTNFLSGAFWDNSPMSGDIIKALYGSGGGQTAYTQNWSGYTFGSCLSGGMNVVYTGTIPATIVANTIYVLTPGTYNVTTPIQLNTCNAFVSSGTVTISGSIANDYIFITNLNNNIIFDHLSINGNNNSSGNISIQNSTNFSLNNSMISNAADKGIFINSGRYTTFSNTTFINNNKGIETYNTLYTYITGVLFTGNYAGGINLGASIATYISNSYDYYTGSSPQHNSLTMRGGKGLYLNNFSGDQEGLNVNISMDKTMIIMLLSGITNTDLDTPSIFIDTYTQHNNPIIIMGEPYLSLTGTLVPGVSYTAYADYVGVANSYPSNDTLRLYGDLRTVSGANWDGILYSPIAITTGVKKANFGEAGTLGFSRLDTIEAGTTGTTTLIISGGSLIDYHVLSGFVGQYLSILKSTNGNTWTINTPSSGCILDIDLLCTFTGSSTLKLFAFGVPTDFSFSGVTQSALPVISGGYYTTGVKIYFTGTNLSGATLSGVAYTSGSLIITGGTYVFTLTDSGSNSTGITFTIDTTAPTFTGVVSGGYYKNNVIITGFDLAFSGFQLSGTYSTGTSLAVTGEGVRVLTGYDKAGNTTGITFIIDKTAPVATGTTLLGSNVTSYGYVTTGVIITFADAYISGATVNGFNGNGYMSGNFSNGGTVTATGRYQLTVYDKAGNTTGLIFVIDTTAPTLTGVVSGTYYNSNVSVIGTDDFAFSGFKLSGTWYAGTPITVTGEGIRVLTGYDRAGNFSTGITFTIDKTAPTFTGETIIINTPIISGGYYNESDVFINFSDLNISGAIISGLNNSYYTGNFGGIYTFNTGGIYKFTVFDRAGNSTGMIFTIDTTAPSVTGTAPTSGQLITGSNTVVFTRTGSDINMSGYYFSLTGTQQNTGDTTSLSRTLTLLNGSYIRYVITSDRAGNTGITQMIPFTVHVPYSGTATLTGPNTMYIGTQRFTKSNANILLWANEPVVYTITGSIDPSITTGTLSSLMTVSPLLTGGDGPKDIFVSMVDSSGTTLTKTLLVTLDTVAPIPTLTTPISGASLAGAFTLNWSAGADAAGISGYQYLISPTPLFGTIIASGFTTTPYVTIPNLTISMSGTLYRKIQAIDRLGNIGESIVQPFYYSGTVADTTPEQFSFNTITNATVNHIYGSNTITITGINTPVLASITRGVLYISGVMVGTTGYIQNGWTVKIEMNSSIDYDTLVTSTLNIGGVTSIFRITTETEADANNNTDYTDISTDLSTTERLQIIAIFEALRDVYDGVKQEEFFSSFMVMLQSKIDDLGTSTSDNSKRDALQYLYDLADQYDGNGGTNTTDIAGTSRIVNGIYTAPNGKKYRITYDSVKKQFTSTNFITPKYYPTLDVLKYDIDRNNRLGSQYADAKAIKARWGRVSIDGTRQTSPYTAPNHKVFYFFKNTDGQISSYTFTTERYFDSLDATKEFIHNSNLR